MTQLTAFNISFKADLLSFSASLFFSDLAAAA
jgi:hypothetical protein